jgi:DNA-directed RNA polymerase subunit RPC12/RpoP
MNFVPIRAYDNYIKATIELSLLKEAGILCHLKDEFTVTIDPLLSPALGGMKLMVAEHLVSQAQLLLSNSDELYLKTVACPNCDHNDLEMITQTIVYDSWAGKIKSLLINGQEQQVTTFYLCNNCYHKFSELPQSA